MCNSKSSVRNDESSVCGGKIACTRRQNRVCAAAISSVPGSKNYLHAISKSRVSDRKITLLIMHVQMMADSQMMADVLQWWINPGTSMNQCGNSSVLKRELGLNGVSIAAAMHANDSSISHKWLNSVEFLHTFL